MGNIILEGSTTMSLEVKGTQSYIWVKQRVYRTCVDPSTSGTFILCVSFCRSLIFRRNISFVLKTSLGENLEGS